MDVIETLDAIFASYEDKLQTAQSIESRKYILSSLKDVVLQMVNIGLRQSQEVQTSHFYMQSLWLTQLAQSLET